MLNYNMLLQKHTIKIFSNKNENNKLKLLYNLIKSYYVIY